jgi:HSP20 family protein
MYRTFGTPNIWRELDRLQRDMNSLFSQYSPARPGITTGYPAINIWHNEDGLFLHAEMPGVRAENIEININANELTVSGQRSMDELPAGARYLRRERNFGKFTRTIQLPFAVDAEKVEAKFKNGVLTVTLPKAEAEKPKRISIKS